MTVNVLLQPSFSAEGSNARKYENEVFASFSKYVREAASGRRGAITLGNIYTGLDEEPPLGFELQPSIQFVSAAEELKWSFFSTANTCSKTMCKIFNFNNLLLLCRSLRFAQSFETG